jgi:Recombinase
MTRNLTTEGRARGRAAGNRQQADKAVSECWDLLPDLFRLRAHGATLRDIAANLNERGVRTRKGADWSQVQVKRLFDRVGNHVEFVIQAYSRVGWYDFRGGLDSYLEAELVMGKLRPTKDHRIEVYSKTP